MAMSSDCSPISSTGTRIPISRASGGLRFRRTFSSAVQAIFGNLSAATTVPGMPASPLTGGVTSAMTTRLALNSKGLKEARLKRRSTKHLPACAQRSSRPIRWRILPVTSILRRGENSIRDLASIGPCYKIHWLCPIGISPDRLESIVLFADSRPVCAPHDSILHVLPVESLQASARQNRRKAAPALGLTSKSLIPSGLNTAFCKTGTL